MSATTYYKMAKVALCIPLIVGLLILAEQFLPLQKVITTVKYKHTSNSAKFSGTTYSIDFLDNNDQFTKEIYNTIVEGDTVELEVLRFSKEVRTIKPSNSSVAIKNDTYEIYAQLGFAIVFVIFSVYFLRKSYFTNKNYRYILIVSLFGLTHLIRIITLNT